MRVLSLYLSRLFVARFVLLLFGLLVVFLSFELMERGDNVLYATGGDLAALPRYALLRLPDFTSQLLPVAALMATVLTIGELARHHELEVIWTTGISPLGIFSGLIPPTVLLVVGQFALETNLCRTVPTPGGEYLACPLLCGLVLGFGGRAQNLNARAHCATTAGLV